MSSSESPSISQNQNKTLFDNFGGMWSGEIGEKQLSNDWKGYNEFADNFGGVVYLFLVSCNYGILLITTLTLNYTLYRHAHVERD